MGVRARLACAVTVAFCAAAPAPAADQTRPAVVHVTAEHPDGRPYEGLSAADFELLLNDRKHPVLSADAGPHPVSLALVIDVTAIPRLTRSALRQTIERLARELEPADRVRLWTVGGGVHPGPPFGRDVKTLLEAARPAINPRPAHVSGPSPVWDAVVDAAAALEGEPGARAIVVLSDGRGTANRHGVMEAIVRASRAGVVVSAIGSGNDQLIANDARTIAVRPGRLLESLAVNTGGMALKWDGDDARRPADLLSRIVQSMRHGYRLTIDPPEGDDPRLIEVRVARTNLALRARRIF